jgi:hypothetical protein
MAFSHGWVGSSISHFAGGVALGSGPSGKRLACTVVAAVPRSSRASARARTCARGRTAVPTFGATVHPAGELLGTSLAAMQATAVQTNVGRFAQPSSAEASFSSYLMLRCPAQGNQGNMRHGRARLGNGYERDPNVRELRQPLAELTIVDLRKRRSHWVSWAPYDEGLFSSP